VLGKGEVLDLITGWLAPGGKVLDMGCGSGHMLRALAERGVSGLGLDPFAGEIKRCRRLRAEEMDQLPELFALVYTRYALHHLDAPHQFPAIVGKLLRTQATFEDRLEIHPRRQDKRASRPEIGEDRLPGRED